MTMRPSITGIPRQSRGLLPARRGSVLIAALWVIVILTGMVLVLGFEMRTEAQAQANMAAAVQASQAELGAEQMLLSVVTQKMQDQADNVADSTLDISLEARPIGGCYVWVIKPQEDDTQLGGTQSQLAYGLTDEMGKLDLNSARYDELQYLPGLTQEMAASIVTWRGDSDPASGIGATDSYYGSLPTPYQMKKAPFEVVDELGLVKDFTADALYGYDKNHNGVIDQREGQSSDPTSGLDVAFASTSGSELGIMPFVTVLPTDATQPDQTALSNSTDASTATIASVNPVNEQVMTQVLTNALDSTAAARIMARITETSGGGGGRGNNGAPNQPAQQQQQGPTFTNVFSFYFDSGMTEEEFEKVYPYLTAESTSTQTTGTTTARDVKVNIMTAPREVLACLPGLQGSDGLVDTIVTQRASQLTQTTVNSSNLAWLVNIAELQQALIDTLGNEITGKSTVFSGDIVAVAPNGRAYKRVRVVIDASGTMPRIIYRRDLTQYGWPLPDEVRQQLRDGQQPDGATGFGMRGSL